MFYYLLYNSSFSFIIDNRLFNTILYGSILYILCHGVLNYCEIPFLNIINNYYWTILSLDIISFVYAVYNSLSTNNENGLQVSFNMLKNQINSLMEKKNNLTITETPSNKYQKVSINPRPVATQYDNRVPPPQYTEPNQQINDLFPDDNVDSYNVIPPSQQLPPMQNTSQNASQFSTPISQLKNKQPMQQNQQQFTQPIQNQQQQNNTYSTPINQLIKEKFNPVEPVIDENPMRNLISNPNPSPNYAESVAGSDLGSVMDLDEFEKTL